MAPMHAANARPTVITHNPSYMTTTFPPLKPAPTTISSETAALPSHETPQTINIGTRKSHLARVQADLVVAFLRQAWPQHTYTIHAISTMGDKNQVTPLHDFGAKSLWTYELEALLLEEEVDMIVHCLKDIPTQLPPTLHIGAILEREDPRDVLILSPRLPASTTLSTLAPGSIIGTSSVRRSAQLKALHPHLSFQSVRGNINTRLAKLDAEDSPYAAIVLAAAGLLRIDMGNRISAFLSSGDGDGRTHTQEDESMPTVTSAKGAKWGMLYAVGQGALCVEMRDNDSRIATLVKPLHHVPTALACLAERSLMRTLEGGCSVPIGVETEWQSTDSVDTGGTGGGHGQQKQLTMRATVVSLDGSQAARAVHTAEVVDEAAADEYGREVARRLIDDGAERILAAINLDRQILEKEAGNA